MTRTNLKLGTCCPDGITQEALDAMGLPLWHNWGWGKVTPAGPGRFALATLRNPSLDAFCLTAPRLIVGNEPQNNDPSSGDGFNDDPRLAGQRAGQLMKQAVLAMAREEIVAGSFFAGDRSYEAYPGTCYTGTEETRDAGPDYWAAYRLGLKDEGALQLVTSWGIHYIMRQDKPSFDPRPTIDLFTEFHDWAGTDIYVTELGANPYGFDVPACMGYLESLLAWAKTQPWMRGIFWSQFPSKYASAGLWKPSMGLTPLGTFWRDKSLALQAELPDPPPPTEPETGWEEVNRYTFQDQDSLYRITVERYGGPGDWI